MDAVVRCPRARLLVLAGTGVGYSVRSAVIGSTRVARSAGAQTDTRATRLSKRGVARNDMGSRGLTPNRKLARKWVSQHAAPAPMRAPTRVSVIPWRITML